MSPKPILLILILLAGRGASVSGQVARPGPDSPWLLAPAFFPAGALVNFVEGDPHKAMPIRVDFAFPDGYRMPSHFHAQEIHVQVQSGILAVGTGRQLDAKRTRTLEAGDTLTVTAGTPHYWITHGKETVITVTGVGPLLFQYVEPEQDPSRRRPFGG